MTNETPYRNILLAALGTTPQIITESLYHLMVIKHTPIQEIHLITTTEGKDRAESQLFQNGQGPFYQFCQEYGFSATEISIAFHVIQDSAQKELQDIRTPEDNRIAADYFLNVVRELTTREDTRIFATIAGGRKTMSAYLHFVMQLLGRDQDTLYHVLVHPESIESNPAFFYPRRDVTEMQFRGRDKRSFTVEVKDIHIDMAEIPFVKLSKVVPENLLEEITCYTDMVLKTQDILKHAQIAPTMEINLTTQTVLVKGKTIEYRVHLSPSELALYCYLCKKKELINDEENNPFNAVDLITIYNRIKQGADIQASFFGVQDIREARSRINRKMSQAIPYKSILSFVQIERYPPRHSPRYVLPIPLENVTIHPEDLPV